MVALRSLAGRAHWPARSRPHSNNAPIGWAMALTPQMRRLKGRSSSSKLCSPTSQSLSPWVVRTASAPCSTWTGRPITAASSACTGWPSGLTPLAANSRPSPV